jgi:hypothetical protein
MADGSIPPSEEALTVFNGVLSVAGAGAALMIRLTGAGVGHQWRYVLSDICGTLALFYLAFLGLLGWGMNALIAVSVAGFAAAAGWAAVFGLLKSIAARRAG